MQWEALRTGPAARGAPRRHVATGRVSERADQECGVRTAGKQGAVQVAVRLGGDQH